MKLYIIMPDKDGGEGRSILCRTSSMVLSLPAPNDDTGWLAQGARGEVKILAKFDSKYPYDNDTPWNAASIDNMQEIEKADGFLGFLVQHQTLEF